MEADSVGLGVGAARQPRAGARARDARKFAPLRAVCHATVAAAVCTGTVLSDIETARHPRIKHVNLCHGCKGIQNLIGCLLDSQPDFHLEHYQSQILTEVCEP
jgi:hypothetical protein